jgi:hypothetical protein
MEAPEIASLGKVPLEKEIEGIICVHFSFAFCQWWATSYQQEERAGNKLTALPARKFQCCRPAT